jgi:predicted TPR repeat methyltransferase
MADASLLLEHEEWADPRDQADRLICAGRATQGVGEFTRILERGRGGLLTRIALAKCQTANDQHDEAVATLREAAYLAPQALDVTLALAGALAGIGALPLAIAEYQRAARQAPDDFRANWEMAKLWSEVGEWDKALDLARIAAELGADREAMLHWIRGLDRARVAPRHSEAFVRHLFDQFSTDYDSRMTGRLGYAAPAHLRTLADLYLGPGTSELSILDLGCGTGLSGKAFAGMAAWMHGVDLSPKMLSQAAQTGLYDQLDRADIEIWLDAKIERQFDLVLAADVLVYLGRLDAVFKGVAHKLKPGGLFLFSVECGGPKDFVLGPKNRYAHSKTYLHNLAQLNAFEVASLIEVTLRYNAGEPIHGYGCAFVNA